MFVPWLPLVGLVLFQRPHPLFAGVNSLGVGSMACCRGVSVPLRGSAAEAAVVAEDRVHVRVTREEPSIEQPAAMHRRPGAQRGIDGIRVLSRAGRQRVVRHPALPALA